MSTRSMIQKADLVLSELNSNGGLLTPEQSARFFRKLIEAPTILGLARTVPMNTDTFKINKIGIGTRVLRAATENTALASGDRSKPVTTQVTLNAREVIAEIRLPYHTLEENIEGENFTNTVLDLVADQASLDIEELAILGDTGSGDAYLALQDGLMKRLTSNVLDADGAPISLGVLKDAFKTLQPKYRRQINQLRWLITPNDDADYKFGLSQRQTGLGDAFNTGNQAISPLGVPASVASLMPAGYAVLTDPRNLLIGIRRKFTLESEKLISERQIKFVLTAMVAFGIEEEEAVVKISNLG